MRNPGPITLLLIGAIACATDHSRDQVAQTEVSPVATPAPSLQGTLTDGKSFSLQELHGKRVVLIFYRSATCGLCIQQLSTLADDQKAYRRLHTQIVAVTTDPPAVNQRTVRLLDLEFPVVSVDQATLRRWGVWPDGGRNPHPATFIIDEQGNVLFNQIGRSAADRLSDAALIFTLTSLDRTRSRNGSP